MENKVLKKFLVMAIVFVITFSNCGLTLQALATSEGISVFGFSLFGKDRVSYKAYFLDENGKEKDEMSADVNSEMTLVLELEPKEVGYLRDGTIRAVTEEGEANFEFKEILNLSAENEEKEGESLEQTVQLQETLLKTEQVVNAELPEVELGVPANNSNTVADANNVVENSSVENNVVSEKVENVTGENTVSNTTGTDSTTNTVQNEVSKEPATTEEQNTVTPESSIPETSMPEDVLVDEDIVYQEEVKENEGAVISPSSAKINSANEIAISNIVEPTKIYVKLAYKSGETLKVSDLYKEASLELSGTYINEDLEEIAVNGSDKITTEWTYSKDILVSSEITKVSPFEVEGTKGTLVESRIVVNRDCTEENYLPLKETVIELEAPQINGKFPKALDVSAVKLKATTGEEINEITFSSDNWNYDTNNNTITIKVENPNAVLTSGEDIYVITYRYDEYVESEEITVNIKGKFTAEEYSGKENNKIVKKFSDEKNTIVNIGELITYSIGTTEDLINKAKINANYNSVEAVYETEYTSTVGINILTNDVLREFTLKDIKDFYVDKSNIEFEATDVKYKSIKFKYAEIVELLNQGGTIEIKASTGELLYTLNKELIKSQDDCEMVLNGDVRGVEISVKDIKANGTITIDFVKSIGKCAYEKAVFNNFDRIESRIKAEVKYGTSDETIELTPLKTEKYFEKSYTRAEISMNKDALSTILDNDNVEIKIELNNNTENSDLYINPEFEVVFPSYVQNVEVKSVNLLYEEGLTVKNIGLFKDSNNVQRMKIQLEGVQRNFSTSDITNGTNIIVNTKIVVDDYTPRKEDQLKMYYFNQGVTNYQSQTEWKISTPIPDGIIKTTNGFDVEVFEFQAPSGFVTANGIENYDGLGSVIETIKQGEITAKAEMGETPRVVTMTLAALNNTGNKCTDVVMLGRIPNTEATDVITGAKLGTNRDTTLVGEIIQADSNPVGCDIYYSTKADADRALNNPSNAWTKTPEDLSQVKSFLIIPTSAVEAGIAFKYSYNVQLPANLPYDVEMYGNFGAYYNNHTDLAVVYESTKADLVGLVTDAGPKLDVSLNVDIGDGAKVLSGKRLNYTITVVNSGSLPVSDVILKAPIPTYTSYFVLEGNPDQGDMGYSVDATQTELVNTIGTINPGETKTFEYTVKTARKPQLDQYAIKDENGYYIYDADANKKYITEVPKIYIENKVTVESSTLANKIESNTVKNELEYANFEMTTKLDFDKVLNAGMESNFRLILLNISNEKQKNVEVVFDAGTIYELVSGQVLDRNEKVITDNVRFDSESGKIYFPVGDMNSGERVELKLKVKAKVIDEVEKTYDCYFGAKSSEMDNYEKGTLVPQVITRGLLEAEDITYQLPTSIKEGEEVIISTKIENIGGCDVTKATFECEIPNSVEVVKVTTTGKRDLGTGAGTGKISDVLPYISAKESITVDITLKAKNLAGTDPSKVILTRIIKNENQEDIKIGPIEFTILNTEKTEEEIFEEEREEFEKIEEEYNKEQENNENKNENQQEENTETPIENPVTPPNNGENENTNEPENNAENNTPNEMPKEENNKTEENNTPVVEEKATYNITGRAWYDENKNGSREDNEKGISSVKVYLLTAGNRMVKSTTTNSEGIYNFDKIENGKYIVAFSYDKNLYDITTYKKSGVEEDRNSDAIASKSEDINAITNEFTVADSDISNIDIGLQNKDIFDLQINKYISKIKVTTSKDEKTYSYDNKELAKVDIRSKYIKGAKVELEYAIVLENKGSIAGNAEQLVDYLGSDIEFDENKNKDWYRGNDGYVYIKNINQNTLNPGEKKEYKLILTKTMTGENTGTLSNKVELLKTFCNSGVVENAENNSSVQNTIITISTGRTLQTIIIFIFIIAILVGIGYNKIPIDIHFNKVYKSKDKKISFKKFYK
ncbi:MAG: DUF11 domain-containing protein [Clostridia bacterium]|nr:DUF11 domain-containing protein [Clostridia bacterium]